MDFSFFGLQDGSEGENIEIGVGGREGEEKG